MVIDFNKYNTCQNKEKNNVTNPAFFIIGTQRSGNTLLRLLLNAHSEVAIPTESSHFMPFLNKKELLDSKPLSLSRKRKINQYLLNNSQFAKWKLDKSVLDSILEKDMTLRELVSFLYSSFALKYGKQVCGDKSPTFIRKLDVLAEAYRNAKFVHIVRDGRDTFLSLKNKKSPGTSSISLSAFEWKYKIKLIMKFIDNLKGRVIEIRYEDLLEKPRDELKKICEFLEIPFEKQIFEFWKQSPEFIAKHHSDLIFKPIDSSNAYKWKNKMTAEESLEYTYFTKKILEKYNYETSSDIVGFCEKAKWWSEVIMYLPKRMFIVIHTAMYMKIASKLGLRVGPAYYELK